MKNWIELSEAAGLAGWRAQALRKGAGHKYIRRVPKPGGGYRYYYKTAGVVRGVGADLVPGAKFKLTHEGQAGHFEVVGRSGDRVTLRHDESGGTMQVSAGDLADLLRREHADVVQAQRERTQRRLDAARKYGTAKQIKRLEAESKRLGVDQGVDTSYRSGANEGGAKMITEATISRIDSKPRDFKPKSVEFATKIVNESPSAVAEYPSEVIFTGVVRGEFDAREFDVEPLVEDYTPAKMAAEPQGIFGSMSDWILDRVMVSAPGATELPEWEPDITIRMTRTVKPVPGGVRYTIVATADLRSIEFHGGL